MAPASWNRAVKRWPSWVLLVFVTVALIVVGATRDTGPRTPGERVDDITQRVACPICDGESVYESRNNASESIRTEVRAQVAEAERTDDEVIEFIADRYGAQVLLVPRATGVEALAWAIPAAGAVCALAGLTVAFRRWRTEAASARAATPDDYSLVDAALADESSPGPSSPGPSSPGPSEPGQSTPFERGERS